MEDTRSEPDSLQNLITRSHGANVVDEPIAPEADARDLRDRNGIYIDNDQLIEKIDDDAFLEPGDMVELSADGSVKLAVYIRTLGRQAQFYTAEGEWCHRYLGNLWWAHRHFVDASEVAPILPYLPSTEIPMEELNELHFIGIEVPREAGAKLIDKMNKFLRAANEIYRAHADRLDHVYDLVADEKHLKYATLTQIACKVLQISDVSKISQPALFTTHRSCMQADAGFGVESSNHWASGEYEIVSKREMSVLHQVRNWLREYQEELTKRVDQNVRKDFDSSPNTGVVSGAQIIPEFVEKARQIVTNSRKFRPFTDSGGIGPSRIQVEPQSSIFRKSDGVAIRHVVLGSFTDKESILLRFLEIWTARRCLRARSQLSAMGPLLLRAIGMYEGSDLDQRTGFTFLQEMGVFAPWENRVAFNTRLALPGYHFDVVSDELHANAIESVKNWIPYDSMKHLRKDWGDLEVFCIDNVAAQEIDDGISLEKIEGDDSNFWIRVHVANPTAFFSPEHPMAKYAVQLVETLYLPEKLYLMLNSYITQKYFSLGKHRPALTFSAKINTNGEILETNIVPSMIHNVKHFSAETIAQELAPKDFELSPINRLVVGHNPIPTNTINQSSNKHMSTTLDDPQRQTLRILKELGAARQRQRQLNGAVNISFRVLDASVHCMELTQPYRRTIRRIEGDPTIVVTAGEFDPAPNDKTLDPSAGDSLVTNIMLLTCEIAALWTSSRGIPVIYRGTRENPDLPSPYEYKRLVLDPMVGPNGVPPFLKTMEYMSLVGRAYSSVTPVRHQIIGTDAYTKVTSPLRRYGDMVAHWQIEAALRHEAETGKSLVGTTDHSWLPFSHDQLSGMLLHISKRESHISHAKRNAQLHWVMQAVFRAFYFKEAKLPETFEVYIWAVDTVNFEQMQGITKELRLDVLVKENKTTKAHKGLERGDWWQAKVEQVDLYKRQIIMTPLRLISRAEPEVLADSIAPLFSGRKGFMQSPR
ncbi:hypothetical protein MMC26_000293 [Xylographa opegraphella]|nr:hypothetical protein [Xylographa opegraphella]